MLTPNGRVTLIKAIAGPVRGVAIQVKVCHECVIQYPYRLAAIFYSPTVVIFASSNRVREKTSSTTLCQSRC
jgi:hypothetical protein